MNTGHNFRYVQFVTNTGVGYACVSFEWVKQENTIKYTAGVSFCSPKDTFNKERARRSADFRRVGSRVNSKGMTISSTIPVTNTKNKFVSTEEFDAMLRNIIAVAGAKGFAPNWAVKAFKEDKFIFGLTQKQNTNKLSDVCATLPVSLVDFKPDNVTNASNV